jgi:hypothetical protein
MNLINDDAVLTLPETAGHLRISPSFSPKARVHRRSDWDAAPLCAA